jgi:hypothetical protein
MPSRRYTLRLPPALDRAVQAHLQATNIPFADLMREALEAYLADSPPTDEPTHADRALTVQPTGADTLQGLAEHVDALTTRVERLEHERTLSRQERRQPTRADRKRTPADTEPTPTHSTPTAMDAAYQRMVALQTEGWTLAQIAAQLTREGHRTRQGRPWHKSTVSYVLRTYGR